jgi:hypothetical protein
LNQKTLFPSFQLSKIDYLLGGMLLLFCFFAFYQGDIFATGWNSLNYLYGNPLEFYENCEKIQGQGMLPFASYPPSIFVVFGLWLYPFKFLGLIKSPYYFTPYLVYWLKLLTFLVYIATGLLFYRVTQIYQKNQEWGKCATWIWLTSPLAIFSEFIFSQYDIFYTFFTLLGFSFFLKKRPYWASFLFGLAITFKYFPFFVFVPLLLFFEKKILKLLLCGVIFLVPILFVQLLYGHSPAYISGVLEFSAIGRVFLSALEISFQKIYYIFAIFSILAGMAYYLDITENYKKVAAYIFLFSSSYPFLFIAWHPQWLIFITTALALTTCLLQKNKISKFLLFDLSGMLFFVAYTVLTYSDNVDLQMFQGKLFHISFVHAQNMSVLFNVFKGFSAYVYLSLFWGYLVLNLILKYKILFINSNDASSYYLYSKIRQRYYLGIFIFIIPAAITCILNLKNSDKYILNPIREKIFGELTTKRVFEQSFKAKGPKLSEVDLFLSTFARDNNKKIQLEVLTKDHKQLFATTRSARLIKDNAWEIFKLPNIKIQTGKSYLIRLTSPESLTGNAITWWASAKKVFKNGFAIVDGKQQNSDFTFRLKFEKI